MVEHLHLDQRQRLLEIARQQLIGLAGLSDSGGMVVGEDHRGGIAAESLFHDLARINAGLGESAAERFLGSDDLVLRVEPDADEHFMLPVPERETQIVTYRAG